MELINLGESVSCLFEDTYNEVISLCEEIEYLYNVRIVLAHDEGIEYTINIIERDSNKILSIFKKNTGNNTIWYLKGLIEAKKIFTR